jgi:hypothetical protein
VIHVSRVDAIPGGGEESGMGSGAGGEVISSGMF